MICFRYCNCRTDKKNYFELEIGDKLFHLSKKEVRQLKARIDSYVVPCRGCSDKVSIRHDPIDVFFANRNS